MTIETERLSAEVTFLNAQLDATRQVLIDRGLDEGPHAGLLPLRVERAIVGLAGERDEARASNVTADRVGDAAIAFAEASCGDMSGKSIETLRESMTEIVRIVQRLSVERDEARRELAQHKAAFNRLYAPMWPPRRGAGVAGGDRRGGVMTHAELVARAERWLRNTRRCGVVLTEASGSGQEIPDAIGWTLGCCPMSTLVECKVSRADFRADQAKTFRDQRFGDMAMGRFRYYMVPAGLIKPNEMPPRWGLLEVHAASVRQTVKAKRWDLDQPGANLGLRYEMAILLSELRKIQIVQGGDDLAWKTKAADRIKRLVGTAPTR